MASVGLVLGGGGLLGSVEAGMARALFEHGVVPDLVCGTSIGAVNGAAIAADPTPDGAQRLVATWAELGGDVMSSGRLLQLLRTGTSLHGADRLRRMLRDLLPATFEELALPFECVAASVETAREHWFTHGDLVDAVVASCALPGVFPPARVGDEHFFDGGLVNSIPLDRAVRRGADEVWVLHVGRVEQELRPPRRPWEVGFVAFEIARRHRFHTDMSRIPPGVTVHVLPTGQPQQPAPTWTNLRYRDSRRIVERGAAAYRATRDYLESLS